MGKRISSFNSLWRAVITMQKLLLSELINQTKDTIQPLNHSKSTLYQYALAWKELSAYFRENGQVLFAKPLAQQFVSLSKDALDNDGLSGAAVFRVEGDLTGC